LRLGKRRRHAQDRLVREEDGALGQRVHVAGEAQARQVVDEGGVEAALAPHPRQLLGGEAQRRQVLERLPEPRGEEEAARGGRLRTKSSNTADSPMPRRTYACSM